MTTSELLKEKCSEALSLLDLDMDTLEREAKKLAPTGCKCKLKVKSARQAGREKSSRLF